MSLLERVTGLFRRSETARHPSEVAGYQVTGDFQNEDHGDQQVFQQLRELGANLSKPRHVVHYLYFPERENRESAVGELEANGYEVHFGFASPQYAYPYLSTAERVGVIDEPTYFEERKLLHAIARRNDGEYDGWEASAKDR